MDGDCKLCNQIRKCIWLIIGLPLTIITQLPGILAQLLWATGLLIIGKLAKSEKLANYAWNLLISIDQLGNTILAGDPDETISSRSGKRQHDQLWAKCLCWFLNKLDTDHCKTAIEKDEGKDDIIR